MNCIFHCYRGCDFTAALWKAKYKNRLPCDTTQHNTTQHNTTQHDTTLYETLLCGTIEHKQLNPTVIPRRQPKHGNSITSVKGLGIDQYSTHEVGRHVLTGGLRRVRLLYTGMLKDNWKHILSWGATWPVEWPHSFSVHWVTHEIGFGVIKIKRHFDRQVNITERNGFTVQNSIIFTLTALII